MQIRRSAFLAAAFAGLSGLPLEAQERIDMKLADMGFIMRPANTPEKMARLQKLPARQFVRRVKNGTPYYIYADPTYCKCAMVGGEPAMNAYRELTGKITPPPGYQDFAKNPGGRTGSAEGGIISDMQDDGETGMDDDLFHPGF
jgi:hypothetical protein